MSKGSKRLIRLTRLMVSAALFFIACLNANRIHAQKRSYPAAGTLKISFINTVHGIPLVLNDSIYTNPFSETYNITKLRYYISNVRVSSKRSAQKEKNSYHLVDAAKPGSQSFSFSLKPGIFTSLDFILGVDSLRNCSGAQTGALDPMNDMFWTWNNGYVMLKIEGSSSSSTQFNNRVEYHIGGYSGIYSVIKKIALPAAIRINPGKTTEIIIDAGINKLWQGNADIKIGQTAICTTPGALAQKIAGNYSSMFSIQSVLPK